MAGSLFPAPPRVKAILDKCGRQVLLNSGAPEPALSLPKGLAPFETRVCWLPQVHVRVTRPFPRNYSQPMAKPVPIGTRAEVERRVEFAHTLTAWKPELPPVLSTPHMIGWMEAAGFEALLPFCEGDEVSVGTAININHRAPCGIGTLVRCQAVLESIGGRFLTFRVIATDGDRVIGEGTIGRAIVSKGRFEERFRAELDSGTRQ